MISNKDLHEELKVINDAIDQTEDPYQKAQLKCQELQVKLLYNIRTNMVTVMKHMGVTMKSNEIKKEQ